MRRARVVKHGACPDCGKIRFLTRTDAKREAREKSMVGVRAYHCGEFWHLGHLPENIRRGRADRGIYDA